MPRPMAVFLFVMDRRRFEINMSHRIIVFQPYIQTVKACKHWAKCSVTAAGTAQCACIPGTTGARCENGPCVKTPCLNGGVCLIQGKRPSTSNFIDIIGLGLEIYIS